MLIQHLQAIIVTLSLFHLLRCDPRDEWNPDECLLPERFCFPPDSGIHLQLHYDFTEETIQWALISEDPTDVQITLTPHGCKTNISLSCQSKTPKKCTLFRRGFSLLPSEQKRLVIFDFNSPQVIDGVNSTIYMVKTIKMLSEELEIHNRTQNISVKRFNQSSGVFEVWDSPKPFFLFQEENSADKTRSIAVVVVVVVLVVVSVVTGVIMWKVKNRSTYTSNTPRSAHLKSTHVFNRDSRSFESNI